jgi:hypothetical protein
MSIQGAVTQQHIWPKFKGDVWEYVEFKEQWHKMKKVDVSEKQLLEIMWRSCLSSCIVERPDKFANVRQCGNIWISFLAGIVSATSYSRTSLSQKTCAPKDFMKVSWHYSQSSAQKGRSRNGV